MSIRILCCDCKVEFWLNDEFYRVAKQAATKFTWYCPNGHAQSFLKGESEEAKLRRERDQLAQRIAEKDDAIEAERQRRVLAERRVAAAKGQVTKLKNRASKGVCPCCNRHFANLERHMATKHPAFTTEPDASDHVH
jgi:hypothetical protein